MTNGIKTVRYPACVAASRAGAAVLLLLWCTRAGAQNSVNLQGAVGETDAQSARRTGSSGSTGNAAVPDDIALARLAPGYLLQMDIYRVPEMSISLMVDAQGNVTIPLVGAVHVGGDRLGEARDAIEHALAQGEILNNPQVSLNIEQTSGGYVTVLGEVQSPGRVDLIVPKSLEEILALSGGETQTAGEDIEIDCQHGGADDVPVRHIAYLPGDSPEVLRRERIMPGDIVFVHHAGVVFIVGAVNHPGGYVMVNHGRLNLTQALSLASGQNAVASLDGTQVLRKTNGRVERMTVASGKMMQGKEQQFDLQDQDIVFVPTNKLKTIYVSTTEIVATASAAAIYIGAGR